MASRRDACRKGHPYSAENTRLETLRGRAGREYTVRRCKRCQSIRVSAYQKSLRHKFPLKDRR